MRYKTNALIVFYNILGCFKRKYLANIRDIIINFEIKNPNKLNVEDSKVLLTESKIIKIRTQISTEKKV